MTDTLQKLKTIAEAATKKDWKAEVWCGEHENAWVAIGPLHIQKDDDELDPDSKAGKLAELDSKYIATMNPSTVLALLELVECYRNFYYDKSCDGDDEEILERIKKGAGL